MLSALHICKHIYASSIIQGQARTINNATEGLMVTELVREVHAGDSTMSSGFPPSSCIGVLLSSNKALVISEYTVLKVVINHPANKTLQLYVQ